MLLFCKIYLLIDGLKLENGILKEVGANESDVFACLSTISFPCIPICLVLEKILKVFTIYGVGGHLSHVTSTI